MPRPQIIRADTMDLQDQQAPSAKDHGSHAARNGSTHHNQSLRHAEQQAKGDLSTSPRVSLDHFDDDDQHSQIDIAYDETEDVVAELSGSHDGENGHYESGGEGDLDGDEGDDLLDDDMMDKISSSPSIDDEDIDFEFVYALHTFVATVEGQANASKGDTMVLLDDSNSYWWLVRVVKDGSIGYLPAEHIETPTERLARLNKHRNVDLSSMMLGDNPEKSKNPLKKAMRRRNAKTVTFASPTFFEASDIDYSTEEEGEEGEGDEGVEEDEASRAEPETIQDEIHDEDIVVEPLKPKSNKEKAPRDVNVDTEEIQAGRASPEKPRPSDESLERPGENVSRSRNGTLRNTDSFFKDDTAEPKKISLTPNLLRDDSGNNVVKTEPQEGRASLESLEKSLSSGEKSKRKDKKPGMLSGLFKRKDKKGRTSEDDGDESEKTPEELSPVSTQSKMSMESLRDAGNVKSQTMQRQTSKLQKQPPAEFVTTTQQPRTSQDTPSSIPTSPVKEDHGPSIRRVVSPSGAGVVAPLQLRSSQETNSVPYEQRTQESEISSPVKPSKPASPKQWQSTLYADEEEVDEIAPVKQSQQQPTQPPPQQKQPQPLQLQQQQPNGTREIRRSLSESPVDVSPTRIQPPGLTVDTSSPEARSVSPLSSERSSPELIDAAEGKTNEATPVSTVSSTATATWSDAGLRSYLEDGSDIKDLLIIVHDNSNVQPAGPDHPITGSLFKHESKRLKEMTGQLDDLLSGWVSRKADRRPNSKV
ncbi:Tip elongation aberrant protein Tea4 [Talaromyces islandicus]|uniref:Tip elongation aberrant protein Tea4 n=1 Tax=Talaromyces islandicus TaxID=28573 RepID=A0A0U1LJF1_TALIS|nr:Tip elongation aberrant protein Tea4 [Talaromyces islandicus]